MRIALNLKRLAYEYIAVNLRSEEHLSVRYKALNPQGFVPTLETDGQVLIQSPQSLMVGGTLSTPALLPADGPGPRARLGCDRWVRHSPRKQSPYHRISAWAAPLRPRYDQYLVRRLDYRRLRRDRGAARC